VPFVANLFVILRKNERNHHVESTIVSPNRWRRRGCGIASRAAGIAEVRATTEAVAGLTPEEVAADETYWREISSLSRWIARSCCVAARAG
jgi:hypothetical protein